MRFGLYCLLSLGTKDKSRIMKICKKWEKQSAVSHYHKAFWFPPPPPATQTHTHTLKCYVVWEVPGSSMVKTLHSLLRAWVQSLVKELRSSSHAVWPKKKKKKSCIPSRSYLFVRYIYQMLAKVLPPPSFIDQIYYFGGHPSK